MGARPSVTAQVVDRRTAFTLGICEKAQSLQISTRNVSGCIWNSQREGQPSKTELAPGPERERKMSLVRGRRLSKYHALLVMVFGRGRCVVLPAVLPFARFGRLHLRRSCAVSEVRPLWSAHEPFVIQPAHCLLQLCDRLLIIAKVLQNLGCHSGQTLGNHLQ